MGLYTRGTTWTLGSELSHTNLNAEFELIRAIINAGIDNTNINASAAIADTKLATISTAGKVLDTALTEAAAGVVRGVTGATVAGTVYYVNPGTGAAVVAAPTTVDLDKYLVGVGTGTSGVIRVINKMTISGATMNVGPKWLGAGGTLLDTPYSITAGQWRVFIGIATSATVLHVMINNTNFTLA